MRYEILGPLRILDDGVGSTLSAHNVEVTLATLLVNADRLVTAEQLITEIWHERPPRTAMASLYVYISQLRKFLTRAEGAGNPIVTKAPGYILRIDNDELDARNFQILIEQGRLDARNGRHKQASEFFDAALSLWRGPALGNLNEGPVVGGYVTWLEETRLECLELKMEASLASGQHRQVVGQLYRLAAEYPLRETFHSQLMLALYRSERRADALASFHVARQILRDQLGLEPGRTMRSLHRAILTADDRLEIREPRPGGTLRPVTHATRIHRRGHGLKRGSDRD